MNALQVDTDDIHRINAIFFEKEVLSQPLLLSTYNTEVNTTILGHQVRLNAVLHFLVQPLRSLCRRFEQIFNIAVAICQRYLQWSQPSTAHQLRICAAL